MFKLSIAKNKVYVLLFMSWFGFLPLRAQNAATSPSLPLNDTDSSSQQDTTNIFSADFDINADGFAYLDDGFRATNEPIYADGVHIGSGGFSGGALKVTLGGIDDSTIFNMSGGWQRTFNLSSSNTVILSFHYNLSQTAFYESDELSQALVSVDGTLYGEGANDFVAQVSGNDTLDVVQTTGWQFYQVNLGTLQAGDHTVIIGGYNNKKTRPNETTEVLIDDVVVASVTGNLAPQSPTLVSPSNRLFVNSLSPPIKLQWSVPSDPENDSLHFLVEVDEDINFGSPLQFDSNLDDTGFVPTPPVPQGTGSVTFDLATPLQDGLYWWRVLAWDGQDFSAPSTSRSFIIDTASPNIDNVTLSPNPDFSPNWYNQNTQNSIDLSVQYDELYAERAEFDLGALGGVQVNNNIASGLDQTTQVQIDIAGASDGTYPLTVSVFDSASNQTQGDSSIALDGTPPTGTVASSPAQSQTLSFLVSWGGTGTDGAGSGLSGRYDVRVQVNGGAWTPWLTDFQGTSDTFTGEEDNTYGFEAMARDNVGNIEQSVNIAETVTTVDTTNDFTAPGPPTNLTANGSSPSPWQNTSSFLISWQNPQDPSGIDKGLYKRGAQPVSNFDTTGSVSGVTSLQIDATQENGQNFYLWFSDNEGNVNFQNSGVVNLRYDATAPTATQASSPGVSADEIFTVSWGGTDDGNGSGPSGVYDVRVKINDQPWQNWLTDFQGSLNEYTGEHGNTYGFEVAAHDVAGNIEAFLQVAESSTEVDTFANDVSAPGPPLFLFAGGTSPSPWQTDPVFQIAWQAPSDPSGIGAGYYKLGSAPSANFDTTGSVRAGSTLNIMATAENGQNFYLWFEDQRGNIDFNNYGVVTLRYDKTPPEIFEMDFLNANFLPNWFNQGTTSTAQLNLEYTEKHAALLRLESVDLGTFIELEDIASGEDVDLPFNLNIQGQPDGMFELKFTLIDSAGNVEQDSTDIRLDMTPPTGTQASSPDTSSEETFTVAWGGTGTDGSGSGLSGIYDVRVQINDGSWQNWLTNFQGTSSPFTGNHSFKYGFEVVAHDNVDNMEAFLNNAESTTVVDTGFTDVVVPTISHTPPLVVDEGEEATIEAQIQDNGQIVEALLFYKRSGSSAFESISMVDSGANTYAATLTAAQIPIVGINYYISASDGSNVSFHPSTNWETAPNNLSVRVLGANNQGLVKSDPQPSGGAALSYRMISVPLNLTDDDPLSVLEDDLGSYDPTKWRLFQYVSSSDNYREFPEVSSFLPGNALWLIVRDPNKRIDSGIGTSVVSNQPFEITLNQGWNDIGSPFAFAISQGNVEVLVGNPDDVIGPYTFQDQWLLPNQVETLLPWEGYSFFSETAGTKIMIHPSMPSTQQVAQKFNSAQTLEPDWFVGIEAFSEGLLDQNNFLGVSKDASVKWDRRDYPEPPFISDYISVRFPHDDWAKFKGAFKTDFRPPFQDGQIWSFEVVTTRKNSRIELKFNNLESLPADFKVILLDKATLQQIDVQQFSEYSFLPEQNSLVNKFDLVIGTVDYVESSETLKDLIPGSFSLSQNFPNPFNAGTTMLYQVAEASNVSVNVLNILGQDVRQLVNQKQAPGVYRVHWDGTGDDGIEMSSGVYIIRLQAGEFHQIRKVILIR